MDIFASTTATGFQFRSPLQQNKELASVLRSACTNKPSATLLNALTLHVPLDYPKSSHFLLSWEVKKRNMIRAPKNEIYAQLHTASRVMAQRISPAVNKCVQR